MDENEKWLDENGYKKDCSCVWLKNTEYSSEEQTEKGLHYGIREIVTRDATQPSGKYNCSISLFGHSERDEFYEVKGSCHLNVSSPRSFTDTARDAVFKEYGVMKNMMRHMNGLLDKQWNLLNENVTATFSRHSVITWKGILWTRHADNRFQTPFESEANDNLSDVFHKIHLLVKSMEHAGTEIEGYGKIKTRFAHIDMEIYGDGELIMTISENSLYAFKHDLQILTTNFNIQKEN